MLNELCLYGGRTVTELTTLATPLWRRGHPGVMHGRHENVREWGTPVGSGGDFERLQHRSRGDVGDGCVGSGQIFAVSDPAVKLKTWETEKLTSSPGVQLGRISGIQNFRFSPGTPDARSRNRGEGYLERRLPGRVAV